MFLKIALKSVMIAVALFWVSACNDKPSDMAINLLPDTVSIRTLSSNDTLLIIGKAVYTPKLPIFNSGSVFIGRSDDVVAVTMLNFAYLPDTLGNVKVEDIQSVELTLFPNRYAFGDTISGNYGFDVYRVNRRWTPDSTTYDSIMVSPANYYGAEKVATYDGRITLADTMASIKLSLPHEMIVEWLKTELTLDTATNTMKPKITPNWGLAFVPKENCNVIYRFEASAPNKALSSKILVKYKDIAKDTIRDLNLVSSVDVTFLKTAVPDTNDVIIQNGLNYWTRFDFDLSSIPRFSGIHKAQFELTLDRSRSRHGNVPLDSIIDMSYFENNIKSKTFNYTGGRIVNSDVYIFPSITSISQYMNKYGGKFSLVLMPNSIVNQSRELERLTFYGMDNPDISKRPTLKIIYSLNPAYLEPNK